MWSCFFFHSYQRINGALYLCWQVWHVASMESSIQLGQKPREWKIWVLFKLVYSEIRFLFFFVIIITIRNVLNLKWEFEENVRNISQEGHEWTVACNSNVSIFKLFNNRYGKKKLSFFQNNYTVTFLCLSMLVQNQNLTPQILDSRHHLKYFAPYSFWRFKSLVFFSTYLQHRP